MSTSENNDNGTGSQQNDVDEETVLSAIPAALAGGHVLTDSVTDLVNLDASILGISQLALDTSKCEELGSDQDVKVVEADAVAVDIGEVDDYEEPCDPSVSGVTFEVGGETLPAQQEGTSITSYFSTSPPAAVTVDKQGKEFFDTIRPAGNDQAFLLPKESDHNQLQPSLETQQTAGGSDQMQPILQQLAPENAITDSFGITQQPIQLLSQQQIPPTVGIPTATDQFEIVLQPQQNDGEIVQSVLQPQQQFTHYSTDQTDASAYQVAGIPSDVYAPQQLNQRGLPPQTFANQYAEPSGQAANQYFIPHIGDSQLKSASQIQTFANPTEQIFDEDIAQPQPSEIRPDILNEIQPVVDYPQQSPASVPPVPAFQLQSSEAATIGLQPENGQSQVQSQGDPVVYPGSGAVESVPSSDGVSLPVSGQQQVVGSRRHISESAWLLLPSTPPPGYADDATTAAAQPRPSVLPPRVLIEESLGDPIRQLVEHHMGSHGGGGGDRPTSGWSTLVTQDMSGLQQLIRSGHYRSAVDLTTRLLLSQQEQQQPAAAITIDLAAMQHIMQLWFVRIWLLVKLQLYDAALSEADQLGELDAPEMFYQHYESPPDVDATISQGQKKGSIVSFSFRVLLAVLPQHVGGQSSLTLDRLYRIDSVCKQILSNLAAGLTEVGDVCPAALSGEEREESVSLWRARHRTVQCHIANTLCSERHSEYGKASAIYRGLLDSDTPSVAAPVWAALSTLHINVGEVDVGERCVVECERCAVASEGSEADCHSVYEARVARGSVLMSKGQYDEAHEQFASAVKLQPGNPVAVNNLAVCLVYRCQLKAAITLVEELIHSDPARHLSPHIIFNLCTMYELHSSTSVAHHNKLQLLSMLHKHRGDGFNPTHCLKMAAGPN